MDCTSPNCYSGEQHSDSMNGSTSNGVEDSTLPEEATVDHALLETLFANEMMYIDSSSPLSPNFVSQHLSEAAAATPTRNPVGSVDVTTIAEKALLRDFGVTSSPVHATAPAEEPQPFAETASHATTSWSAEPQLAPASTNNAHMQSQPHHHHTARNYTEIAPAQPIHTTTEHAVNSQQVPNSDSPTLALPPVAAAPAYAGSNATNGVSAAIPGPSSQHNNQVPQERLNQLVSQFTTLASRLGIELPSNVLQSLTSTAAACGPMTNSLNPAVAKLEDDETNIPGLKSASSETSMDSHPSSSQLAMAVSSATPSSMMTSVVQELRKTAEEAIAAVSDTRKRGPDEQLSSSTTGTIAPPASSSPTTTTSAKPMYSKRRKKPRLSDCETKLAELQAENDLLKRHLENVSNKSYRFEQEKAEAGERFKNMLDGSITQEQIEKSLHEFTDLYSDYGKRRQQELSFHLDQLKR